MLHMRIVAPLLKYTSDELREKATSLVEDAQESIDMDVVEVLRGMARVKDFADYIFSDELKKELNQFFNEGGG